MTSNFFIRPSFQFMVSIFFLQGLKQSINDNNSNKHTKTNKQRINIFQLQLQTPLRSHLSILFQLSSTMIVTKPRKSLQPSSPYMRQEKQRYSNENQQPLSRDYRMGAQTAPINRQRHSISTISPINKNGQQVFYNYGSSKKTEKKYDYSVNLNMEEDLNAKNNWARTNLEANDRERRREPQNSMGKTYKVDFVLEEYERKRAMSVAQSSSKHQPSVNTHLDFRELRLSINPSSQARSRKNSQTKDQKVDIKSYIKNYQPRYESVSKLQQKRTQALSSQNKENFTQIRKPLMSQNNFFEDNFGATDKFKEFTAQQRLNQEDESKNRQKYEPKYSKMRKNKRCDIINKEQQVDISRPRLQNYKPKQKKTKPQQSLNRNFQQRSPVDYERLLKYSRLQNTKIVEKLSRISKLNEEINSKLEKMLNHNKRS